MVTEIIVLGGRLGLLLSLWPCTIDDAEIIEMTLIFMILVDLKKIFSHDWGFVITPDNLGGTITCVKSEVNAMGTYVYA